MYNRRLAIPHCQRCDFIVRIRSYTFGRLLSQLMKNSV